MASEILHLGVFRNAYPAAAAASSSLDLTEEQKCQLSNVDSEGDPGGIVPVKIVFYFFTEALAGRLSCGVS